MKKLVAAEKAHAKFSASGSKMWLECSGSIALAAKAPPQPDSPYGKEGTEAHSVLEYLIKNRKKRLSAAEFLAKKHGLQMVLHAEAALDYVEKRLKELGGAELQVEIRCDLPVSEPGQFGTTDIAILEHFGKLIVMDYKYGAGVPVHVEENSQLIYYALGLAHLYDYNFSEVEIVVIQPRRPIPVEGKPSGAPEETIRSWTLSIEDLLKWRDIFEAGIKRAKAAEKNPEAHLKSGDHCRFCAAKPICPEIGNMALRRAQADFDDGFEDVSLPSVPATAKAMPKLDVILPQLEKIETWIEAVREHAENVLASGGKIRGYALVEKRGQRKWDDYDLTASMAKKLFGKKAFSPSELLSPAQFEKVNRAMKEFADENTSVVSSGMKLGRVDAGKDFTQLKDEKGGKPHATQLTLDKKLKAGFGKTLNAQQISRK